MQVVTPPCSLYHSVLAHSRLSSISYTMWRGAYMYYCCISSCTAVKPCVVQKSSAKSQMHGGEYSGGMSSV